MSNYPTMIRIEDEHGDATYLRLDCVESIKPIYDITVNRLVGLQLKTIGQRLYQLMNGKPGDTESISVMRKYIREGLLDSDSDKPLFPNSTQNPDALKEMDKINNQKNASEVTTQHKLKLLAKQEKEGINHG